MELNSIVVLNGITPAIRKEDLVSRTVFIETGSMDGYRESGKIMREFTEDLPKILGGLFNIIAKALQITQQVDLSQSYRMMEFTTIGYAIAEAIDTGLGNQFMEAMARNEKRQLQEVKKNEPLITVFQNFLTTHPDGICWPVEKAYEEIIRDNIYHAGLGSTVKDLPKAPNAFSRKVKSLKSLILKYGISVEIGSVPSNNYHTISIEWFSHEKESFKQDDSLEQEVKEARGKIVRKPIMLKHK
jgi:hypothetical protein